ncbi:hypothetical protein FHG87_022833 [Trinorchestia longiramus]|nr:hypothetical protein FHG87_022833 [Trinorchestia longiramus]
MTNNSLITGWKFNALFYLTECCERSLLFSSCYSRTSATTISTASISTTKATTSATSTTTTTTASATTTTASATTTTTTASATTTTTAASATTTTTATSSTTTASGTSTPTATSSTTTASGTSTPTATTATTSTTSTTTATKATTRASTTATSSVSSGLLERLALCCVVLVAWHKLIYFYSFFRSLGFGLPSEYLTATERNSPDSIQVKGLIPPKNNGAGNNGTGNNGAGNNSANNNSTNNNSNKSNRAKSALGHIRGGLLRADARTAARNIRVVGNTQNVNSPVEIINCGDKPARGRGIPSRGRQNR